jgi:ferredoxin--NADP+ reductase
MEAKMAYVITSKCERCGSCSEVCPSDAIYQVEDDAEWPTYYIYPENCIECAACEAECDAEAIYHEDEVPEDLASAIQKNIDFFESGPGKGLV